MSTGRRTAKHKDRGDRKVLPVAGVSPPNKKKFEEDVKVIVEKINGLEEKIKPVPTNVVHQLGTEISKDMGKLSDMEKVRETKSVELRTTEVKIKEVGLKYSEKKRVASELLAGVRHKTEGRHDEAVERLEYQITLRRLSSSEERKFKQEVEALRKSKERLGEWLAAKQKVDELKRELDGLRRKRDDLHVQIKESRSSELRLKDEIVHLRQELEEAKERKKISLTERDEINKKIESLHEQRKQLYDVFRSEELAYVAAVEQSKLEEKERRVQKREQNKIDREKMKALSRDFIIKQQYEEKMSTCSTLIHHLQKLSLTTQLQSHGDGEEDQASSQASATPPLERAPMKAESDPTGSPGTFLRRKDREEMLIVPKASSLTRKRSKKEKRKGTPVVKVSKPLLLNATIFRQFNNLGLNPPNSLSDIPSVIAQLNDRMAYFEGMIKSGPRLSREFLELVRDSGLGSSAPSEILDVADRYMEFTSSQEEAASFNLDPGLGAPTPFNKTSNSKAPTHPDKPDDIPLSSTLASEDVPVANENI